MEGTQAVDMIQGLLTTFGIGGALVWYLYYTTSSTLPGIIKAHADTIDKIVARHDENTERIASKFTEALVEERAARAAELKSLQDWFKYEGCRFDGRNQLHEPDEQGGE